MGHEIEGETAMTQDVERAAIVTGSATGIGGCDCAGTLHTGMGRCVELHTQRRRSARDRSAMPQAWWRSRHCPGRYCRRCHLPGADRGCPGTLGPSGWSGQQCRGHEVCAPCRYGKPQPRGLRAYFRGQRHRHLAGDPCCSSPDARIRRRVGRGDVVSFGVHRRWQQWRPMPHPRQRSIR